MRARMTVDPRLLPLLGAKLYTMNPLPIVVRELLQNSRDACRRKGVEPDIQIVINTLDDITEVTCVDNGVGMTEQQLADDFLCLGNTSKHSDTGAVGGFGIAKAALMRNPEWQVWSLDNYVDHKILQDDGEIQKVEPIVGTKITVRITDTVWSSTWRETEAMMYYSDVRIRYIRNGDEKIIEPFAWDEDKIINAGNGWVAHMIDNTNGLCNAQIYRIYGLVQFVNPSYQDPGRGFNILVNLHTSSRPSDPDYPLSIAREKLTGVVATEVASMVQTADANPLSTVKDVDDPPAQRIERYKRREGYLLHGSRDMAEMMPIEDLVLSPYDILRTAKRPEPAEHEHVELMLYDYKPEDRDSAADARVLRLWRELLITCAKFDDHFGIGITTHPKTEASRLQTGGISYYLINPDVIIHSNLSPESRVLKLYLLACHETAHYTYESHGELHTVETQEAFFETLDKVRADMPSLLQILTPRNLH